LIDSGQVVAISQVPCYAVVGGLLREATAKVILSLSSPTMSGVLIEEKLRNYIIGAEQLGPATSYKFLLALRFLEIHIYRVEARGRHNRLI